MNSLTWSPQEWEWCCGLSLVQGEDRERMANFRYQQDARATLLGRLMLRAVGLGVSGTDNR